LRLSIELLNSIAQIQSDLRYVLAIAIRREAAPVFLDTDLR